MFKKITRLLLALWVGILSLVGNFSYSFAQVTLTVSSLPANTPAGATLYVAGNFNAWNPSGTALIAQPNGTYTATITPAIGMLEFKFTRGSWLSVEGNESGTFMPNRTYNYTGGAAQINDLSILSWEDLAGSSSTNHTANAQVSLLDLDFYMPQLDRYRRIWLYLPPDYSSNPGKHYPVLYMHDGQNLFDAAYSFAGEWGVDEILTDRAQNHADYGCIVVGIDNGGTLRIDEYSPWQNPAYGGGDGDEYVSFIVNTLKPFIDEHYRTLAGREHTGIMGSSMGGLISFYAALQYPEVFGRAGIFSPSFWFSNEVFAFAQAHPHQDQMRIDFVCGDQESATMVPLMQDMYNLLLANGFDSNELRYTVIPGGQHNEALWHNVFGDSYTWLFDNTTTNYTQNVETLKKPYIFPNPVSDYFTIALPNNAAPNRPNRLELWNYKGNLILDTQVSENDSISVKNLPNGLYFLHLKHNKQTLFTQKLDIVK